MIASVSSDDVSSFSKSSGIGATNFRKCSVSQGSGHCSKWFRFSSGSSHNGHAEESWYCHAWRVRANPEQLVRNLPLHHRKPKGRRRIASWLSSQQITSGFKGTLSFIAFVPELQSAWTKQINIQSVSCNWRLIDTVNLKSPFFVKQLLWLLFLRWEKFSTISQKWLSKMIHTNICPSPPI